MTQNHLLHTFACIAAICLFFSCSSPIETAHHLTVVSGQLSTVEPVTLYLHKTKGQFGSSLVDSVHAEHGHFVMKHWGLEEGYYALTSSQELQTPSALFTSLYLCPADSLHVSFAPENTVITGPASPTNSYGAKAWQELSKDSIYQSWYAPRYELPKLNLTAAQQVIEHVRQTRLGFLEDHFEHAPAPQHFKAIETANIDLDAAYKYLWYLRYHAHMTLGNDRFDYMEASDEFYTFIEHLDLNDSSHLYSYLYPMVIDAYMTDRFIREHNAYDYYTREGVQHSARPKELAFKLDWIDRNLSGTAQTLALYALLSGRSFQESFTHHNSTFFEVLPDLEHRLEQGMWDVDVLHTCTSICADYSNLKPGSPAPELKLPGIDGQPIALSDFKGKAVYVDFWGTWCGPCVAAIPDQRELQTAFEGQNVVFLNVAMEPESEPDTWKTFLERADFPGHHVRAAGQFSHPAVQAFKIERAPSYVLIHPDGTIALPRAPEPKAAASTIQSVLASKEH